jgi:hypothetical protein
VLATTARCKGGKNANDEQADRIEDDWSPSSNRSCPEQKRCEGERRFVEGGGLFVSGGDPVEALEPVEAALDRIASPVGLPVEPWWSPAAATAAQPVPSLVGLLRDGLRDATFAQIGAEAAGAA